ncbi:carbohydrate ABC transporter permease [Stigmatella aurantiaca]|uniref:Binding-protein-dependent transport systems inner membrane component n=1 Tax=Stigmatella aurantiaca (strain DW4/3-1) TaxID=378806 RepID=Q097G3_STIAD|nr:carbohydrate ABC transporter permease [Stigmatella aurantiaca]ADO69864.1 Mannitol ABC transporter, permease protein [Stigmatella aurantiaca DW4/3-1]EAU67866.1 binding-protein-dependent transport systems inner membrane component [Stigmatella aurantiaca DW4/3-1]
MSKLNQRRRTLETLRAIASWVVALIVFFPILWMVLTSFKTELEAFAMPPEFVFRPTLENYREIMERSDYMHFAWNSLLTSGGSTLLGMLVAVPAAYGFAFHPTLRTRGTLMWMLSTKMLPGVGVLVPIYLISRNLGLLDSRMLLVVIFALINLPIMVWMIYTYFRDIPRDILEAARMDGATTLQEIYRVLLPVSRGGLASTALLALILSWNEAFWSLNLTTTHAAPLSALVASFSSPEGLFWAKLSAVSTLACAPIIVIGWGSQKQLVRGLTFGAVK